MAEPRMKMGKGCLIFKNRRVAGGQREAGQIGSCE